MSLLAVLTLAGALTLSSPLAAALPDAPVDSEPTATTPASEPVPAAPGPDSPVTIEPDTTSPVTSEPVTSSPEIAPPTGSVVTDDTTADAVVSRPGVQPSVRSSDIPVGSIVLAVLVLAAVGLASYVLVRRRPTILAPPQDTDSELPTEAAVDATQRATGDTATLDFLVGLGQALIDAGDAVSHVESTLRAVARVNRLDGIGLIVLPTALMVSVPNADDVITEVSVAGRTPLRLDQIDDVLTLVQEAERGTIDAARRTTATGGDPILAVALFPQSRRRRLHLLDGRSRRDSPGACFGVGARCRARPGRR